MSKSFRQVQVGLITLLIAAPIGFFLFAMGLVVVEWVMLPLATLGVAVVAALAAAWVANPLTRDDQHTDVGAVASRNLAWGLIPAAAAAVVPGVALRVPPVAILAAVLIYACLIATRLAFRHRSATTSAGDQLVVSLGWLIGTIAGIALLIFVASRFGLTGA